MEESAIIQYFEGKTIFITGATGFLAKVFLEKILRIQPNIKKLFLLVRGNNKISAEQRLEDEVRQNQPLGCLFILLEVINIELFRILREGQGTINFDSAVLSKLVPVSGDVSHENLGIFDPRLREEMFRDIDMIVNSSATTRFDERYDVAFRTNAVGTMHVRDFAKKCLKLDTLLHVSTAFVHGERVGLIPEKPFHIGEMLNGSKLQYLDISTEKKIIEERLEEFQTGDHKVTEKEILRAMKDLGAQRTLDSIFVAYAKRKIKVFVGDLESILDMILKLVNLASCNFFESLYTNASGKLNHVLHLVDLYKPYLFFRRIFDDAYTENLRVAMRGRSLNVNMDVLNFDPMCIQWDEYFVNTHLPGVVKYALK